MGRDYDQSNVDVVPMERGTTMNVWLPLDLKNQIVAEAEARRVSRSHLVTEILTEHFGDRRKETDDAQTG